MSVADRVYLIKRGIVLMVATALGVVVIGYGAKHDPYEGDKRPTGRGPVITEDDPRWDCRTMGNGVCGE